MAETIVSHGFGLLRRLNGPILNHFQSFPSSYRTIIFTTTKSCQYRYYITFRQFSLGTTNYKRVCNGYSTVLGSVRFSSSSSSDTDSTDLDEDGFRKPRISRLQPSEDKRGNYYSEVSIEYIRGLPQLTIPMPSRKERCRFSLRPITDTVGNLISMIMQEDRGIDRCVALTMDGTRIAASNRIEVLFEADFRLIINDNTYLVRTPKQGQSNEDEISRLNDVRNIISQLYETLNVKEFRIGQERILHQQLETLRQELLPIEEKRLEVETVAQRKVDYMGWVGLGLMSVQFGILARLTWWEYSWDIMEPVTYFVTYGTAMAAYAYYVVTKQEYILNDVRNRQHLLTIHKKAKKMGIDLTKYNQLKDEIRALEIELRKSRSPLITLQALDKQTG